MIDTTITIELRVAVELDEIMRLASGLHGDEVSYTDALDLLLEMAKRQNSASTLGAKLAHRM